jgi:hypothetical protein
MNVFYAFELVLVVFAAFFKTGPMAWNGSVIFWYEAVAYLAWSITMAVVMLKALSKQEKRQLAALQGGHIILS